MGTLGNGPYDNLRMAHVLNGARNALIAGRSALACGESLSDELRDYMSRAIAACEDATIALDDDAL